MTDRVLVLTCYQTYLTRRTRHQRGIIWQRDTGARFVGCVGEFAFSTVQLLGIALPALRENLRSPFRHGKDIGLDVAPRDEREDTGIHDP